MYILYQSTKWKILYKSLGGFKIPSISDIKVSRDNLNTTGVCLKKQEGFNNSEIIVSGN
jgi:hypothetical protein